MPRPVDRRAEQVIPGEEFRRVSAIACWLAFQSDPLPAEPAPTVLDGRDVLEHGREARRRLIALRRCHAL
jgi:hypothetical protein